MFWIISIIIFAFMAIIGHLAYEKNPRNGENTFAWGVVCLIITSIVFILGTFISSNNHITNLEEIEYYEMTIEIQKDKLESLKQTLSEFDYTDNKGFMNADSPISSTIQEIAKTESEISYRKEKLADTKRKIRTRERWFFSHVVWYYSD